MGDEMSEKQKKQLALAEEGKRYQTRVNAVQSPEIVQLLNEETAQAISVLEQSGNGHTPTLRMNMRGETILDEADAKYNF